VGTSSARPENLDAFARSSRAADDDLLGLSKPLGPEYNDFLSQTDWGYFDIRSLLGALGTYLDWNEVDARWVAQIAAAFRAAGSNGGLATLPDGAITASLRAAGLDGDRKSVTFDDPVAFGFPPTTGYANDPVNTASGNFVELETDLGFGGLLAGLTFARTYNSRSDAIGAFGPGWSSWADARLRSGPDGAEFAGPDGQRATFPRQGAGYGRVLGVRALVQARASGLTLDWFGAGETWEFDGAGRPAVVRGAPGTAVRLTYDADGRLAELTHATGKRVDVRWDGDRVVGLDCSDGRSVAYGYDDAGTLVEASRAAVARRYEVDEQRRIVAVIDADGVVEVRNVYDAEGRVAQQTSPFGRRTSFHYLPGRVTVTNDDAAGCANTYVHDRLGRLLAIVDGDDQRLGFSYDQWGNPVAITERGGAVTVQEWDERARLTRRVMPSGAQVAFAYDDRDRVVEVTAPGDAVTRYRYEGEERSPAEIVDPEGGVTRMTVAGGLVREIVDPDGVTLRFEFDGDGNVVATIDGDGAQARLQRDATGRVVAAVTPLGRRTTFAYDAQGLAIERRDPAGGVWQSEYTPAGRLSAVVDPTGAREEIRYGRHGLAAETIDALGNATAHSYDTFGNVTAVAEPGGATTSHAYDALSRLTAITDPVAATWRREYDADGNLVASVDPTGVRRSATVDPAGRITGLHDGLTSSAFEFDELGRTLANVRPDGTALRARYDRCGRRVAIVDPAGGETLLEYSPAGRVLSSTAPSGRVERYEYDRCGRVAARFAGAGRRWEHRYDADGAVVELVAPTGEAERFSYDAAGRVVERAAPGRGVRTYAYDAAGRPTQVIDRVSGRRRFEYDAAGRMVAATDANGAVTRYRYDARGLLIEIVDALGARHGRSYDEAGRLVAETDSLGRSTTLTYDAAGRVVERVDGAGVRGRWTHDASGRIASFGAPGGRTATVKRDALGREIEIDEPGLPANRLRWDSSGHLVERSRGELAVSWRYDADGRRAAIGYPDGTETTYDYDAGGFLVGKRHPALGSIALRRDDAGRLVGAEADGMRARWTFDGGDLGGYEIETGGVRRETRLERDPIGRVVAEIAGGAARRYRYDDAGRLVASESPEGLSSFTYDDGGRLVREASADGIVGYEHDAAGQLVRRVPATGPATEYAYDGAGRRIRETGDAGERGYEFDELGSLSAIVTGAGTATVSVDALGELAEVDGAPVLWDTADPLAPLAWLGEQAVVGYGTPWALAGDGDGAWLAPDWQGTVGAQARDPWGAVPGGAEADPAPRLGYRGELELAGDSWLRNRLYQPAARSFLAPDPLPAVPGTATAANPWSYAADNPIGLSDPLGLRPVTDAELQEYRDGMNRNVWQKTGDFVSDNWEYIAAGAMVVAGVGLMFTGVGGPAGIALMAASSGLITAGGSAAIQKFTTGDVNWGQVAVAGAVGVAAGGLGAGAGMFVGGAGRIATASPLIRGAAMGGSEALVGGAANRGLHGDNPFDPAGMGFDLLTGGAAGGLGGKLGSELPVTRVDSERVIQRAIDEPGPYHNFPAQLDDAIYSGDRTVISRTYAQYSEAGSIGKPGRYDLDPVRPATQIEGRYEIGVRPSMFGRTETVTHRFFRPGY
jgi:RHS repeat-associated protein